MVKYDSFLGTSLKVMINNCRVCGSLNAVTIKHYGSTELLTDVAKSVGSDTCSASSLVGQRTTARGLLALVALPDSASSLLRAWDRKKPILHFLNVQKDSRRRWRDFIRKVVVSTAVPSIQDFPIRDFHADQYHSQES